MLQVNVHLAMRIIYVGHDLAKEFMSGVSRNVELNEFVVKEMHVHLT
jgi:hypothetical protein